MLRDLNDGWFGLGFAKSRGLGTVKVKLNPIPVNEINSLQIITNINSANIKA